MHELSYVQGMIEHIEQTLRNEKFNRVTLVHMKIGRSSGIEPSCIDFCFESAGMGTVVEGAKLKIEVIPCKIFCRNCRKEFFINHFSHICPECLHSEIEIVSGQEIELTHLEVE